MEPEREHESGKIRKRFENICSKTGPKNYAFSDRLRIGFGAAPGTNNPVQNLLDLPLECNRSECILIECSLGHTREVFSQVSFPRGRTEAARQLHAGSWTSASRERASVRSGSADPCERLGHHCQSPPPLRMLQPFAQTSPLPRMLQPLAQTSPLPRMLQPFAQTSPLPRMLPLPSLCPPCLAAKSSSLCSAPWCSEEATTAAYQRSA